MSIVVVTKVYNEEGEYDLYFSGEYMGTHRNSVGYYGDSTGIYAEAESTCPLTEYAEKNNLVLIDNKGFSIPKWE